MEEGAKESLKVANTIKKRTPFYIPAINSWFGDKLPSFEKGNLPLGRIKKTWIKKAATGLKIVNKIAPFLAVGATTYEMFKDDKLSAGDAVKLGLLTVGMVFPMIGLGIGVTDLVSEAIFDDSLTRLLSSFADKVTGNRSLKGVSGFLQKLKFW